MARPLRLRIRFRVMISTAITRIKPAVKVASLVTPVAPMGPLMMVIPVSLSPSASAEVKEKCRPFSSTPT